MPSHDSQPQKTSKHDDPQRQATDVTSSSHTPEKTWFKLALELLEGENGLSLWSAELWSAEIDSGLESYIAFV